MDRKRAPKVLYRHVLAFAAFALGTGALAACSGDGKDLFAPVGDIRPPFILEAWQAGPGDFRVRFDESVVPVPASFAFTPAGVSPEPAADGAELDVSLRPPAPPGIQCALSGEVEDMAGNRLRFLFSFAAYNDRPARLVLNEIQTGKNSSASSPHRDYLEFIAEEGGNTGGVFARWASSVKCVNYVFPPCEAAKGEIIVLHCAPEGIPEEKDETGTDLAFSGGIDSSPGGRDFWTDAGPLPDQTAAISVHAREEEPPYDGIFYGPLDKSGEVDSGKLVDVLDRLKAGAAWPVSAKPAWEDAFRWKSSPSRPLHRTAGEGAGAQMWTVGETGSHSPGKRPPGAASSRQAKADAGKRGEAASPASFISDP